MTTWTVARVPSRPPSPDTPRRDDPWTCLNCDHVNVGRRRRCRDCGTARDAERS